MNFNFSKKKVCVICFVILFFFNNFIHTQELQNNQNDSIITEKNNSKDSLEIGIYETKLIEDSIALASDQEILVPTITTCRAIVNSWIAWLMLLFVIFILTSSIWNGMLLQNISTKLLNNVDKRENQNKMKKMKKNTKSTQEQSNINDNIKHENTDLDKKVDNANDIIPATKSKLISYIYLLKNNQKFKSFKPVLNNAIIEKLKEISSKFPEGLNEEDYEIVNDVIRANVSDFSLISNATNKKIFQTIVEAKYTETNLKLFDDLFVFLSDKIVSNYKNEKYLNDKVYDIPAEGFSNLIIISDLHGDRDSMMQIIEKENFFIEDQKKIIFLGDYIDRGPCQVSVLLGVMVLKFLYPERVFLLRGNHEYWIETDGKLSSRLRDDLRPFLTFWSEYLNKKAIKKINVFFNALPGVVRINNSILLLHAGVCRPKFEDDRPHYNFISGINDLNDEERLFQMAWSEAHQNGRGVIITGATRFSFAAEHLNPFLEALNVNIMIRGHDVESDGFNLIPVYDDRLLTLFSTGSNPEVEGENTGYKSVKPCYATVTDLNSLKVKRIYEDEVVKELKISEINYIETETEDAIIPDF